MRPAEGNSWGKRLNGLRDDWFKLKANIDARRKQTLRCNLFRVGQTERTLKDKIDKEIAHLDATSTEPYLVGVVPVELLAHIFSYVAPNHVRRCKLWLVCRLFLGVFVDYGHMAKIRVFIKMQEEVRLARARRSWDSPVYVRPAVVYKRNDTLERTEFLKRIEKPEPLKTVCSWCAALTTRRCKGCYQEYYCSKPCQRRHWGLMHRHQCLKPPPRAIPDHFYDKKARLLQLD